MALVGHLMTAESREDLRSAITDKAFELAKRLGLTHQEGSIIATQMIQAVENTKATSNALEACDDVIEDALGSMREHREHIGPPLSVEEHWREQGRKDAARVIAFSVDPDYKTKTSEDDYSAL